MFCWDLSNVTSCGNWLFRWDCVFLGGTLYPTANYGSVSLVVGFRGETLDTSAIIR